MKVFHKDKTAYRAICLAHCVNQLQDWDKVFDEKQVRQTIEPSLNVEPEGGLTQVKTRGGYTGPQKSKLRWG